MIPGQWVLLVQVDDFMPPIRSVGMIVGELDAVGDHEVLFPSCLCPVPPGTTWEIPEAWLVPLAPIEDTERKSITIDLDLDAEGLIEYIERLIEEFECR